MQALCGLLKREQGAAFKNKGNPLVFVLACNLLYTGFKDSKNWPDLFIKVLFLQFAMLSSDFQYYFCKTSFIFSSGLY